jgi:hypothetical protein
MFKAIAARLLAAREPAAPRFVAPENKGTESVPAFRASLRAAGLTEAEASAVMVARAVAGMVHLHNKGYSWDQIDSMPAARYLAMPTDEAEYYDYCRSAQRNWDATRLIRMTCGLT